MLNGESTQVGSLFFLFGVARRGVAPLLSVRTEEGRVQHTTDLSPYKNENSSSFAFLLNIDESI